MVPSEKDRDGKGRGADPLEGLLDDVLVGETTPAGPDPTGGDLLSPEDVGGLLGLGPAPADHAEPPPAAASPGRSPGEDLGQDDVGKLMDDAYAAGRRLARVGDCVLMVSEDGLRAWFRGRLPEGTRFADVVQLLEEQGIRHGVVQNRIHGILPHKRRPQRRADRTRDRSSPDPEPAEVVIAEGQAPVAPDEARIEYLLALLPDDQVTKARKVLGEYDYNAVRECSVGLPLVQPGQLLARVVRPVGKPGRDVFGAEMLPPTGETPELRAGENAALSEDAQECRAATWGYACLIDEELSVLTPIWVSKDLLRVYFVLLPQSGPVPAPEAGDIGAMLEAAGVAHGVLDDAIAGLCGALARGSSGIERATLIARGTDATPGRDAEWRLLCDPELTQYFGEIRRVLTRSQSIEALIQDAHGLSGKAVSAGERLGVKEPPRPGGIGRDVFGEEFLPDDPKDVELEEAENVQLAADGGSCAAAIYGYIGLSSRHSRVQIISPVWISAERMTAYLVNLPQLGDRRLPVVEEVERLLEMAEVSWGVDHQGIAVMCERGRQGLPVDLAVRIASGRAAVPGETGGFEFAIDREPQPVSLREDGSVDFRQLNLAPLLAEGQLIGTRRSATPGVPGTDLGGGVLPALDGVEAVVTAGKNVRVARLTGEPDGYHSEIEGELVVVERSEQSVPAIHLAVLPVLTVKGDVDYHVGNVDFPGSVHVTGAVRPGFSVKAEGNVLVGDSIEEGASIAADGNLGVRSGITGEHTRVTVGGDVFVRYVNNARVQARGSVNVSEYIFGGTVRADGEVIVHGTTGGRASGVIAGGTVIAGQRIRAFEVGSDTSAPTQLIAGVDAVLLRELAALQERLDQYQAAIGKALRSLQAERLPAKQIRQLLLNLVLKAHGERKKMIARVVRNVLELQKRQQHDLEGKQEIEKKLDGLAAAAVIEVGGRVARKSVVKIGGCVRRIGSDGSNVTGVRFWVGKDKDGTRQLQMTAG